MALLKIYDDIANENQAVGFFGDSLDVFSADRLSDFLKNTNDAEIDARVHCMGGSVTEGYTCLDLLTMSGKKISVTVEGMCASIATVLLFAAPLERRKIYPNARLIIHNPYIPEYTLADSYESKDLAKLAADLEKEENRMLDLYVKNTKATREQLKAMMDAETEISAQLAVELGFVSEVLQPSMNSLKAKLNDWKTNNSKTMDNTELIAKLDKQETILNRLLRKFGLVSAVALVLTDSTGAELTLEKESGEPMVGDKATPDGTFVMEDGTTITVLNGEITEVKPKEEPAEDVAALKAENESLKQQLADKDAAQAAAIETAVNAKVQEVTAEAVALTSELKALKSQFKPDPRVDPVVEPKAKRNPLKDRIAQFEPK